MAGSRLDRIGTIFSRTTGLLKAGGIKYPDRPLWYDIYRVFPPKYEPHVDRESEKKEIMEIFYKEDKYRALFFKKFGLNPGGMPRKLGDKNFEEPTQPFITSCLELKKTNPDWNDDQIFEAAAEKYSASRTFTIRNPSQQQQEGVDGDGDAMEESAAVRRHGRKTPTITAQSLLTLFKEAKEKQEKSTEKEAESKSSSKPSGD